MPAGLLEASPALRKPSCGRAIDERGVEEGGGLAARGHWEIGALKLEWFWTQYLKHQTLRYLAPHAHETAPYLKVVGI